MWWGLEVWKLNAFNFSLVISFFVEVLIVLSSPKKQPYHCEWCQVWLKKLCCGMVYTSHRQLQPQVNKWWHHLLWYYSFTSCSCQEIYMYDTSKNLVQWVNGVCCATSWFVGVLPHLCSVCSHNYLQWLEGMRILLIPLENF